MTDLLLTALWLGVLALGLGVTVLARRLGLPATHVRDLLHVGAGVWVLGWPWWDGLVAPLAIVWTAAAALWLVPLVAPRVAWADRFRRSVSDAEERFDGLILYAISFAVMTTLALLARPFPAAAALLALALGDGLGGVVGRRLGRRRFAFPWGKPKSVEGSVAVAIFAAGGAVAAGSLFGATPPLWLAGVLGVAAGAAEALAPRATDNVAVPAVVWGVASVLT